jgi:hypothetical protein
MIKIDNAELRASATMSPDTHDDGCRCTECCKLKFSETDFAHPAPQLTCAHQVFAGGCRAALGDRLDDAELSAVAGEPGSVGAIARSVLERREQERIALDAPDALVVKGPTPEQLPAVRAALDQIRSNPPQIRIHNNYDPEMLAAFDTESGRDAVRKALKLGPYARPGQQQILLDDPIAIGHWDEERSPGRPDGFDQGRIDEIKAAMLAAGPRRGGR